MHIFSVLILKRNSLVHCSKKCCAIVGGYLWLWRLEGSRGVPLSEMHVAPDQRWSRVVKTARSNQRILKHAVPSPRLACVAFHFLCDQTIPASKTVQMDMGSSWERRSKERGDFCWSTRLISRKWESNGIRFAKSVNKQLVKHNFNRYYRSLNI